MTNEKALTESTPVKIKLGHVLIGISMLASAVGGWAYASVDTRLAANTNGLAKTQHALDLTLIEMKHDREKANTHMKNDLVMTPGDVRDVLRVP